MLPYILFIIILLFFYWRRAPLGMLITIILFAALRYDTGWDYMNYYEVSSNPSLWDNPETTRFSLIWCWLFQFAHDTQLPHISILIPNILTYVIIYISFDLLKLDNTQKVDALLVYVAWEEFYLGSFSIIRQQIAMSLGLLMFSLIQCRRFKLSIIPYLLAVWLHSSACILIFLYPVYCIRKFLNFKWLCIASIISCLALGSAAYIISNLDIGNMSRYSLYLDLSDKFGGKITYVKIILVSFLLISFSWNKNISNINRQCYFFSIIALISNIAIYYMGLSSVINRMFSYYAIFLIYIFFPSLSIFKSPKIIKPLAAIILVAYFFTFLLVTRGGEKKAASGFIPYKCILYK